MALILSYLIQFQTEKALRSYPRLYGYWTAFADFGLTQMILDMAEFAPKSDEDSASYNQQRRFQIHQCRWKLRYFYLAMVRPFLEKAPHVAYISE
ncbi:hypothetical protein RRF57_006683 [Xylaria bambusicola]|uniref:Uncharacterized protein n=1 Tax=Xylaria bambusicola TaxID=326684 RepID=A0AAN7Z9F3_9PEZI